MVLSSSVLMLVQISSMDVYKANIPLLFAIPIHSDSSHLCTIWTYVCPKAVPLVKTTYNDDSFSWN
jgi:hypothetical protein